MESLFSYLNSSVIGVFAILLFSYYMLWRPKTDQNKAAKGRSAPEAPGAWPLIGHLHLLAGPEMPHRTLGAMADKHGPIFTIRMGMHRALVVCTWELAKECYTACDAAVSNRPKSMAGKLLGDNYLSFGFAPYGTYWRDIRKIVSQELLSVRRQELLQHTRTIKIRESINDMYKHWNERKSNSGQVLFEMKQWTSGLTLSVILKMVVGKQYSHATSPEDREEAGRCQSAMREFFHLAGQFVVGDTIPFLGWLDLGGYMKAMKQIAKELDGIFDRWLKEHQSKRNGKAKGEQDFMDVLIRTLESTNLDGYDVNRVNKATCMGLITGGTDTTAVQLIWALTLLLNNPHALKKAQDELDIQVGKERLVDESDVSKLVYVQAIVKESLRLYPAGPLGGMREFTDDCIIGGYNVPKGTRLLTNLWKIQSDPRVWSEPLKFQPERFLKTHKDIDVKGQHFQLIPFGGGRRSCPGTAFALQMLHLTLASLLQAFELSTPSDAPVDMREIFGMTNAKATPLEVVIAPRLPTHLYD